MAISEAFSDSATISTTEYFLASDSTTKTSQTDDGVYQLWLDLSALALGDEFELKGYEKVGSGGTDRVYLHTFFAHAQTDAHFVTPSLILLHGWEFSLKRLAGSDRSIAWSIRKVA